MGGWRRLFIYRTFNPRRPHFSLKQSRGSTLWINLPVYSVSKMETAQRPDVTDSLSRRTLVAIVVAAIINHGSSFGPLNVKISVILTYTFV